MNILRDRWNSTSFKARLLALLVVVSLIQAGAAALTFHNLQSKPLQQQTQSQLDGSLRAAAPAIDDRLASAAQRARALTQNANLLKAVAAEDYGAATAILDTPGDGVAGAYFTGAQGETLAGTKPTAPVLEIDRSTAIPLQSGSQLLGTLHVPVVFDQALMTTLQGYATTGVTMFVDAGGVRVTHREAHAAAGDDPLGVHRASVGGTDSVTLVRQLGASSVRIGAALPQAGIAKASSTARRSLYVFVGMLALMMLFVAWLVSSSVSTALRRFAGITERLAAGELGNRIPVHGSDEVAILAGSFNDMAASLEERIANLGDARVRLRRQVELFGEALANATESSDMLTTVCTIAIESTEATHARFWVVDDEGRAEHAACIGLRPHDVQPCGLEREVMRTGLLVLSEGAPQWLVAPARTKEGMLGLLTLVSTQGMFPPEDLVVAERLGVQAAFALDNAKMHQQLMEQATRDGLTGLANHRTMQDELARQLTASYRSGMPLGATLLDVDNFKKINDTYGHQIGDEALKAIARALQETVAGAGFAARYGGEEFVVLMPGCDAGAAWRIADRIREAITFIEIPLEDGGTLRLTASFGVSNTDQQIDPIDSATMLHHADMGLYRAKHGGKNRVELWSAEAEYQTDRPADSSARDGKPYEAITKQAPDARIAARAQPAPDGPGPDDDFFAGEYAA